MKCAKYLEIISAFVDSEATPLEQLAVQEHIKTCPHCKAELSNQYALKEMMSNKFKCGDSFDMSALIMQRIKSGAGLGEQQTYCHENSVAASKWAVAAVMAMTILATAFAVNFDKKEIIADSSAKTYASYIYEHLADSDFISNPGEHMVNQASYIK